MPLKKYGVLNTPPDKKHDNITELAAYVCATECAMICLVQGNTTWVKSQYGVGSKDPGVSTLCKYAVNKPGQFIEVEDIQTDERIELNNQDLKEQHYYAAYVLQDKERNSLGVLCVIDKQHKKLNNQQKSALMALGEQVESLFELNLKNKELRNRRTELKSQYSSLKDFAGVVSHDLKMPLSSIIMTIDVLKSGYTEHMDEQGVAYLDRLKRSAFNMSGYISNILEYYETENISSEDYKEPFDLKGFLEGIVDMLNIESACEINLPANSFDLVCNKSGLEQILLNLLGNSLKYNDKEKTIIDIDAQEEEDCYKFSLTDNGMGIPEDKKEEIFKLFSIVNDRDKHGNKGNGIGLSTVKKLVERLEGQIDVTSEVGKYTTFSFTIKKQKSKKHISA